MDFDLPGSENQDLTGLADYLTKTKTLLESLYSEKPINFIFEKIGEEWKYKWTKGNIDSWVDKTSNNKAILILENSSLKQEEFESLYEFLKKQTSWFNDLSNTEENNKKTILLTKIENEWKRPKEEIKKWLESSEKGNNKFEIEIQTSNIKQTLEDSKEENLVGLLNYLTKNKTELFEYKNPEERQKITLTLEKKKSGWEIIHNQNTINNWISNTSEERVSLELWDNGTKKELSDFKTNEFKELLISLKEQKDPFTKNLESASKNGKKTIIFEKYTLEDKNKPWVWTHIKTAIKNTMVEVKIIEVKIQNQDLSEKSIDTFKDNELIGLLKYLQEKGDSFEDPTVVLKKNDDEWQLIPKNEEQDDDDDVEEDLLEE